MKAAKKGFLALEGKYSLPRQGDSIRVGQQAFATLLCGATDIDLVKVGCTVVCL